MSVNEAGRSRLEATLSSPLLSNKESVYRMLRHQLSSRNNNKNKYSDKTTSNEALQSIFTGIWDLLELLRSASGEENHNLSISGEDDSSIKEGWKLKHDTGQLRVMYREGPKGTPYHTLLAEGFFYSPLTSALCLAWEAPSYNKWWPEISVPTFKIVQSHWVNHCSLGEDVSLIRVKVPWPLAAREVIMYAFELEVFDEELIIVLLHSVPDNLGPDQTKYGLKASDIPKPPSNVVRIDLAGGFALQRVSEDQCYFRTVANMDIKLEFVPPWLINFISRQLVGLGFKHYQKTLISISNGEGSSKHFQQLIETQPLYARVEAGLRSKEVKDINGKLSSIPPKIQPSSLKMPIMSEGNAFALPRFTISFDPSDEVTASFETLSDVTSSWKASNELTTSHDASYEDSTVEDSFSRIETFETSSRIDTFDEASSRVDTNDYAFNKVSALDEASSSLSTLEEESSNQEVPIDANQVTYSNNKDSDSEIDPEVQHALHVLDKIINIVKLQKLRQNGSIEFMPAESNTAESSEISYANAVISKGGNDLADNENPISCKISNGSWDTGSHDSDHRVPKDQKLDGTFKKNKRGTKMQPKCFPFRRSFSKS